MTTRGTRRFSTGETCPNGYPIFEDQSWVELAQGGIWRTDYKVCCEADCVNAKRPGV